MRRRLGVVATAVLVPVVLVAGLVVSAARGGAGLRFGEADFQISKVDAARFEALPDQPVFVLVIGHDARPGESVSRGDALHLIGVNPGTGQATILNIPRDTLAPIAGLGSDKITHAYMYGGPALQARAVGQLVGVDVRWVISTGFEGFMAMVDELGGMEVDVPFAMADAASGAYFSGGPTHMLGGEALALARNRNLSGGDFTRTHNQGLLIVSALARLRDAGPTPANTMRWLSLLLQHATFEGGTLGDLYRLGRLALSVDPANVRTVTMPGVSGNAGDVSVVFPTAGAASLFADFRDDAVLQAH